MAKKLTQSGEPREAESLREDTWYTEEEGTDFTFENNLEFYNFSCCGRDGEADGCKPYIHVARVPSPNTSRRS